MFNVGDNVAGKFLIQRQLTPGQFGTVFLAQNYAINRRSFLKLVECDNPRNFRELIEAYSQNCNHPNVGRIYAAELIDLNGPNGLTTFVLMEQEFLDGITIQGLVEIRYLPIGSSARYISDTLHAMEYLQGNGITHGDIKPNNIVIVDQQAKLVDFGLSRNAALAGAPRARDEIYRTHQAPEFSRTNEIDEGTDVYSCGITLFRAINQIADWHGLVTGVRDWEQLRDSGQLLKRIGYRPEVPRKLRMIVNRACAVDPADRYGSCAEFRRALDRLRFIRLWTPSGPNEWSSFVDGISYSIDTTDVRGGYCVSVKRNNRRLQPDIRFATRREADEFVVRYLYENTVA
ncbi:serine/threonine protein kinase [Mesorhizobium abyssinicae]|uniref:serine/threonine protein kinase n=1 Tax=Mesorhizobium abyssinicae TaxID=1209958 RepID=UPI003390F4B7